MKSLTVTIRTQGKKITEEKLKKNKKYIVPHSYSKNLEDGKAVVYKTGTS